MKSSVESTNGLSCLHPYPVDAPAAAPGCSGGASSLPGSPSSHQAVIPYQAVIPTRPSPGWVAVSRDCRLVPRLDLPSVASRYIVLLSAFDELAGHRRNRWRQDQTCASATPTATRPPRGCVRVTRKGG